MQHELSEEQRLKWQESARAEIAAANAARVGACVCPVADEVARRIVLRANHGMKKYGVNCARGDLTVAQWLTHAQEEAMDLAVYLQRLIQDLQLPYPAVEIENARHRTLQLVRVYILEQMAKDTVSPREALHRVLSFIDEECRRRA